VHLIGLIGKSNRVKGAKDPYKYAESAIKEANDAKLYEGVPVYLGHTEVDAKGSEVARNPKDKIATVLESTHKAGKGGVGKLQFNTGHPYYEAMQFWVDRDPSAIMMSHVADLKYSAESNQITKITKVHSVDIVINGNTTQSMFKEGVLADAIKHDDDQRRLQRTIDTAQSLMWRILYPEYGSEAHKKQLTDPEKAVLCSTIAKDLVKELNALRTTKKEEAADMEMKDLTIELLKKDRPDLFKSIESATLEAESKVAAKIEEAVKDIPSDKRSKTFLKQVREAVVADDKATLADLVSDRKDLLVVKTPESTIVVGKKIESAQAVKAVVVDLVPAINKALGI